MGVKLLISNVMQHISVIDPEGETVDKTYGEIHAEVRPFASVDLECVNSLHANTWGNTSARETVELCPIRLKYICSAEAVYERRKVNMSTCLHVCCSRGLEACDCQTGTTCEQFGNMQILS